MSDMVLNFFKLREIPPFISKDEFEEGTWYHLPPTQFNKRKDFIVIKKEEKYMVVRQRGATNQERIWYNAPNSRLITKPWRFKVN